MNSIVLIQLISDETMQNVLPALALRPGRVVHLATPVVKARARCLRHALKACGVRSEAREITLSAMPDVAEVGAVVRRMVEECRAEGMNPVVNFTGGTKLMSIGAFAGAQVEHAHSLYVDTAASRFIDGRTKPGLDRLFDGGDMSLTCVSRRLTLPAVAIANGCERITNGGQWRDYAELARYLLEHEEEERRLHDAVEALFKWLTDGKKIITADNAERLTSTDLDMPDGLTAAGCAAGLLKCVSGTVTLSGEWRPSIPDDGSRGWRERQFGKSARAVEALKFAKTLLTGGWWEVAVARAVAESGYYHDLRWSVLAGARSGTSTDMEEDVLALDGIRLLYVSCKRTSYRQGLSRHLEEVVASARRIGGRFAEPVLAVRYLCGGRGHLQRLRNRAGELGVRIVDGEDVMKQRGFHE